MDEILKLSVKELRTKLCSGEVKSTDVVKACFNRIKEADPKVKAFLQLNEEQALKQAAISEDKTKSGMKCGYFEGVPIAIKDNVMIKGEKMTGASKYLENYIAPYDATVIEKLRESGAVIIGKTNMDELAMGGSTETSAFHKTTNPWDMERIPGGSSGGSAAAVSAGMVPFAIGSDTGGSIRQPAAFCGVVGFKPSYGLVSRSGACALASSFDQIGTFSKTVKDTAMLFTVISGKDYRDPVCEPNEEIDYTHGLDNSDTLKNVIIGVPKQLKEYSADPEIIKSFESAVKKLEAEGAKIVEVDIPSLQYVPAIYQVIMCAEVSANIATFDGIRYGYRSKNGVGLNDEYCKSRGESMGYEVKKRVIFGTYVLGAKNYHKYFNQAQKVRTLFINEINEAYKKCDVIFTPSVLQMPVKFGEKMSEESEVFLIAANIAGLPGITVPSSFTSSGMPAGVHFMGQRLSDAKLLQIAAAYEKISGFERDKFPLDK
ncbi:MAG: Asp-tRNA(Asn)/Glu-tRNA(Gln) amidotransferase subunit GatA [Endomicrobia bacterium]|nr:Asp-tRNA(Asn)/Glu-tRNA(Gln) amidotransferase subunit GatA [Endomicrobiia bacterium]MCL2506091.1 Asp-tRNA(Asn)/Glu-tRNA(Gln) amidotransferase subunit GatA [Endomicrobiia bacterium]